MYRLRAAAGVIDVTLYLTTTYGKIKENSDKKDQEISIFTNQMIEKIQYNLEKFHYNVIIANLYESYNFFNNKLNTSIDKKTLFENYSKFLSII